MVDESKGRQDLLKRSNTIVAGLQSGLGALVLAGVTYYVGGEFVDYFEMGEIGKICFEYVGPASIFLNGVKATYLTVKGVHKYQE
jgi:hypothetical protein